MEALTHIITSLGVVAISVVIFAESGLLIGFFLPGDSLLFTSGFLIQQNLLSINIHLFVLLIAISAILGDNTGYAFGNKIGRKLFKRNNSRLFKKEYLLKTEAFFDKHGSIAIVLARFVPIVRTFTSIVAGASKMKYQTFLIFNIVGGALWTAVFIYLGFYLGKMLTEAGVNIEAIAMMIIFISVLPMFIAIFKKPQNRQKIAFQLKTLFRKKNK